MFRLCQLINDCQQGVCENRIDDPLNNLVVDGCKRNTLIYYVQRCRMFSSYQIVSLSIRPTRCCSGQPEICSLRSPDGDDKELSEGLLHDMVILERLQQVLQMESRITSQSDRVQYNDLQSLLCATLQVILIDRIWVNSFFREIV